MMKIEPWKYKEKGYLEFTDWQDVEVLFSLRDKTQTFLNHLTHQGFASLNQIHSNQVITVNRPDNYEGDGFLTDKVGFWLTVFVADCLPVYIYDTGKKVIGLVHAGKKGTQKLILRNAISLLIQDFGSNPNDISLLFGPSICPKCYDYNIWSENIRQAKEMGVSHIINPEICTAESTDMFYSYNREKGTKGRMVSAIKLKHE